MPKLTVKVPSEVQTLPLRLQQAIDEARVTQAQLAKHTGVAQSAISRLCSTERKSRRKMGGSVAHVAILAEALRVRVGWLIMNEPPERAPGVKPPIIIDADAAQNAPDVRMRAKHHKG